MVPCVAAGIALVVLATGCGRFGYDPSAGADGDGGLADGGQSADGGLTDAATVDAGVADDCRGDDLVCSGFEGDVDSYWNREREGTGSFEDECPGAHRGDGCLVARVESGGAAARAERRFAPQDSGWLYLRLFAYLDPGTAFEGVNLGTLHAAGSPIFGPDINVLADGQIELYSDDLRQAWTVGAAPIGSWFCIELGIDIRESGGSFSLLLSGGSSILVEDIDTSLGSPYDYVAVGIDWSAPDQPAAGVRIDDVVVAKTPRGCP